MFEFEVKYRAFFESGTVVEITRKYKKMPSVLNKARYAYMWAKSIAKYSNDNLRACYAITSKCIVSGYEYICVKHNIDRRKEQIKQDINDLIL